MAKTGPKPKPTALKVLMGNPGKRPLPQNEPKPKPVAPKMPDWLDREAKREWRRVAPELERLGLLTVVDGAALAAYCQAYSQFVAATKELKAHQGEHGSLLITQVSYTGVENKKPHPAIKVANEAAQLVARYAAEFGLTPSARTRIQLPGQPDEEPSAIEKLLSERRGANVR